VCNAFDGAALIVGADGIDINLAGHVLGVSPLGTNYGALAIENDGHSNVTIRNGSVDGTIDITGASRNLIRDVDVTANGTAIHIEGGEANQVRASSADGSHGNGIFVSGPDAVVADNDATTSLGAGIGVRGDGARIVRNRVPAAQFPNILPGIELGGSDGRIVDNRVTGGWLEGGIILDAGADNVIAENQVSDIRLVAGQTDDRFGDGIVVGTSSSGTLLRNNLVQRNDGDGMDVRTSDARLRGNSAFDNRLLGINAVAGVTDLGGNQAHGNGNPLQCVNVFCSP
jgi:parallel beta-helix repeat protein